MKYAIDETELARLEQLKEDSDNNRTVYGGDTIATVWYQSEAANAVPALIAEIRGLREKVEAWEWFGECFEAMMWVLRADILNFDGYAEARNSTEYARGEAVHADRE